MSEADLARAIASRFPLYDKKKDEEAITRLADKLAMLTKAELIVLDEQTAYIERRQELVKTLALIEAA
jgi:hypothetical protein